MAKEFCVIDCETDPFKQGRIPQPFIWGLYAPSVGFKHFTHIADLMAFLQGKEWRVYAHNGGKFDFHYMLDYIPSWEKIIVINGRLAQFRVDDLEFCDSYCILPVPLASYQKTSIDYNIFEKSERDKKENREKIIAYLKDDCVFLYELIEAFIKQNGFALTIASSAIKQLQKIESIKIKDHGRIFFESIRPYYYGGRVQCFQKGLIKGDIQYFDINSAYPYAMKHQHPFSDYHTTRSKKPRIVGHNFYKLQADSLGAFPFRNDDGSLDFPDDGKPRIFCVTGWELIAAKKTKLLKNAIHIEQKDFAVTMNFSRYVDYWYNIKNTSKKGSPEYIFAKLYLNSAYGKLAADPSKYKTTYLCDLDDFESALEQGYNIHGELHDRLLISRDNDEEQWRHYNVATGASITGFVRAYLLQAIKSVEKPLYCDTDSLVFTGAHSLSLSDNLGSWKEEGRFVEGGIGGKKIYCFRDSRGYEKTACKGLQLGYDDIIKVCKGESVTKTPEAPIFSIKRGKYFLKKTIAMT